MKTIKWEGVMPAVTTKFTKMIVWIYRCSQPISKHNWMRVYTELY